MNGTTNGKLKRTLKERCPECGKVLQVRTIVNKIILKGEEAFEEEDFITCSDKNCYFEKDIPKKKRKRKKDTNLDLSE